MKTPELLAPAGNWIMLRAAINAKADSIYFGLKQLNMRMTAGNFELNELKNIAAECRKNKIKAYLCLNTIIYDREIKELKNILRKAREAKIDAIICWDFSVVNECEKLNLPVHLSTQASMSNFEAVKALKSKFKNITRINLARELSLEQVKDIIKKIKQNKLNVEIECFIHGAMCVSISGRCFLSQHLFGKSANRGECLQPCRREYVVYDPEDKYKLKLGSSYVMSPKDLCALPFIDKLIEAGINAFKIEGRNRSPEYVKTAVECYKEAISNYKKLNEIKNKLLKKLKTAYNRGFSSGFYLGMPTAKDFADAYGSKATSKKEYVGKVLNFYKKSNVALIKVERLGFGINSELMFQGNKTGVVNEKAETILNDRNEKTNKAKKGSIVTIKLKNAVRENDKVYLIKHF
ncbi:MAG: peptidase U32 family protein [Candidatus Woesearchaeota archaeon]|nr:peptidase U32 family protein [Candidatus Woesearchaeota archaeon]